LAPVTQIRCVITNPSVLGIWSQSWHRARRVGLAENQLPEAHRLVHDAPHGSVNVATYPQLTCHAIDVGA
jgi:hypothetical protein